MERVLIIGCCGAGKSTFAKRLAERTGLEVVHLDQYYWLPDWREPDKKDWEHTVAELIERPAWIMDGNYRGTLDVRARRADTVVFLDASTAKCLWRITQRILRYRGSRRPDMAPGCAERFDLGFFQYVVSFNLRRRKHLLEKLDRYRATMRVVVLHTDAECSRFLAGLPVPENDRMA